MQRIASRFAGSLVFMAAALAGLTLARGEADATTFNPVTGIEVAHSVSGANSDVKVILDIAEPDSNFSSVISFVPRAWGIGNCDADTDAAATRECADQAIPDGTLVGLVEAQARLGLINNACNSVVPVQIDMLNATTEMSATVDFEDKDGDGKGEQFEDGGGGLPGGVVKYPAYLTRLIRNIPFGLPGSEALQPLQRSYGQTVIGGVDVSLQYVVLSPGVMVNGLQLDPANGYPVVTVLQNTGDPGAVPVPDAITDFCTPVHIESTTFGMTRDNPATAANESGRRYATNPAAGQYGLAGIAFSGRDDDDDGIENALDPCPTQGNAAGWDPRDPSTAGDADGDGLPADCDPNDDPSTGGKKDDEDGDGFANRGDKCPTVPNADQTDADRDEIGNVCDPDPLAGDDHVHAVPGFVVVEVAQARFGDSDCDGDNDAVDALQTLRFIALLEPAAACVLPYGDINCDGKVDAVDALGDLRFVANLPVSQQGVCPPIGTVTV